MIISLVCGIKTWLQIRSAIDITDKSKTLQKQERQLFTALLIQFIIPFLGNTVPMLILFACPALHISTEPYTNYISMSVPFYPIFDAIATTFIIKDYYRGVLSKYDRRGRHPKFLGKSRTWQFENNQVWKFWKNFKSKQKN